MEKTTKKNIRRKNVFYKPLAMELNRLGHDILEIIPHRELDGFYLFSFEDTKEFRRDFTKLSAKLKKDFTSKNKSDKSNK